MGLVKNVVKKKDALPFKIPKDINLVMVDVETGLLPNADTKNTIYESFKSNDLSILKYSVPNFIKNNSELMKKIKMIDFDSVNSSLKGNFDIILKKKL